MTRHRGEYVSTGDRRIGAKLRQLRESRKLSTRQLASAVIASNPNIRLSQAHIRAIETGHRLLTDEMNTALSAVLRVERITADMEIPEDTEDPELVAA